MQKGLQKEKGGLYIKQGLFMNEDSPTVMFATRSMISKGALDIIRGLFIKEALHTVMCAGRSTEVKKTLEVIWGLFNNFNKFENGNKIFI